jgi:hypothetical protein
VFRSTFDDVPVIGCQDERPASQCGGLKQVRQVLDVVQRPGGSSWIVLGQGVINSVEYDADKRLSHVVEACNQIAGQPGAGRRSEIVLMKQGCSEKALLIGLLPRHKIAGKQRRPGESRYRWNGGENATTGVSRAFSIRHKFLPPAIHHIFDDRICRGGTHSVEDNQQATSC